MWRCSSFKIISQSIFRINLMLRTFYMKSRFSLYRLAPHYSELTNENTPQDTISSKKSKYWLCVMTQHQADFCRSINGWTRTDCYCSCIKISVDRKKYTAFRLWFMGVKLSLCWIMSLLLLLFIHQELDHSLLLFKPVIALDFSFPSFFLLRYVTLLPHLTFKKTMSGKYSVMSWWAKPLTKLLHSLMWEWHKDAKPCVKSWQ